MLDELRFQQLWHRLGAFGDAEGLFASLNAAYAEPQRHYHGAAHLFDCLHQLDIVRDDTVTPDEIEAALWFHDAIYDPHASDNEARSAHWAVEAMEAAVIDPNVIQRVAAMILATRHDADPPTRDCEWLLDIDLSILGREPEAFDLYEQAILQEYAWVPIETYRIARAAILERFLARPAIYRTASFRSRFESQARQNLAHSIAVLRV